MHRFVTAILLTIFSLGAAVAPRRAQADQRLEKQRGEIEKDAAAAETRTRGVNLSFTLPGAGLTSAGIYDATGRLVRVLWTCKRLPAGEQVATWDANDALGAPVPWPATNYTFKVVVNHSTYTNIGTIGNTAAPPDSYHHVPINFEAVAVGRDGAIYTVHDWDEPHNDVIRWSPDTGAVLAHSGHPWGGLLKAVAVDDDFAYVTGYSEMQDRAKKSQFVIIRLRIAKEPNRAGWPVEPFTKAGRRISVYNGGAEYPAGAKEADRAVMTMPLLSLAIHGGTLYATDSLAGKVHCYDKVTGAVTGTIAVRLPQAVAVAADGRVWVGHEHSKISVFDPAGTRLATPITDLQNVGAITFGPDGALYVADQGAGQVRVYMVTARRARLRRTFGQKAQPGDRAADRFYHLHGVAVDGQGNLITAQNEFFFNGGRLAKFAPGGKLLWEQMGLEFSSNGNYSPDDPDTFYSFMEHTYRLDRQTGGWRYLGNSFSGTPYRGGAGTAPRIGRLGGQNFAFLPAGDGVQVYRIEPPTDAAHGPVMRLVSILGRASPLPTGEHTEECWKRENRYLWSWNDAQGDSTPQPEEIVYWARPEDGKPLWQYRPITIDAEKNLWITSADRGGNTPEQNSIWMVPLSGTNSRGNPIYEWKNVRRVIAQESLLWPMGMKMAQHDAASGMTYVYGHTPRKDAPQHGGAWMGGNALAGFEGDRCKWQIVLPDICVSIDAIPGGAGGCIIGGNPGAGRIHHYTRDGLLIGSVGPDPAIMGAAPNNPSGFLDMFGAVTVNRDPRDGILDVFVEDNYNLRIAWYRIDDRPIETIEGKIPNLVRSMP